MNRHLLVRRLAVVLVSVTSGATPAIAQDSPPERAHNAVYERLNAEPELRHRLYVDLSAAAGYDDNVFADFTGGQSQDPMLLESGSYSEAVPSITYSFRSKRIQLETTAGTSARYYHDGGRWIGVRHTGAFGFAAALGNRSNVQFNQSVSRSPAYMYGLLVMPQTAPAVGSVTGQGAIVGDQYLTVYETYAGLTHQLGRRNGIELASSIRRSDISDLALENDYVTSYSVGGRYRHGLARDVALRLGYFYRSGEYSWLLAPGDRPATIHDLDIGIDYARALSFSRRTSIDFRVGSSIINAPVSGVEDASLQYRMTGVVGLRRDIGRTWQARVAYSRGSVFSEAFDEPVFLDAINASLDGFLSRRVDALLDASWSVGDVASASATHQLSARQATARVRYAIARTWAVFAQYEYYFHDLGGNAIVPRGIPLMLDRNAVQVGITTSLPLVRKR